MLHCPLKNLPGWTPSWSCARHTAILRLPTWPPYTPLLSCGSLWSAVGPVLQAFAQGGTVLRELSRAEALEKVPVLATDHLAGAVFLPEDGHIDVHELLWSYLRHATGRGVVRRCGVEVRGIRVEGGRCRGVVTNAGEFSSRWIVNAAGAWAGRIARLAGAAPIALTPLRRTIITFPAPAGIDPSGWPLVHNESHRLYFKPESGGLLACPMDETPSEPCDAQPDDETVALAVERIRMLAPRLVPRVLRRRWAGLRTFAPDRVLVAGEISNLHAAGSGHLYFTLKDERSQLRCAMFRSAAQLLVFRPQDGQEVIVRGRVSLYPERGDLQLYVDALEPQGRGALQLAFEQLKARLAAEGLFDEGRKRALPFFPSRVGVATALNGAALHDILVILRSRCPALHVVVRPIRVQGIGAAEDICQAIADLNAHPIVAHGRLNTDTSGAALHGLQRINQYICEYLLELSRAAFVQGLNLAAGISAVVAISAAVMAAVLLRHVAAGARVDDQLEMQSIPAEIDRMSYVSDDRS